MKNIFKFIKNQLTNIKENWKNIMLFSLLYSVIFFSCIAFIPYNTDKITLTNAEGQKIVILGMIHSAPTDYYKEITKNIKNYKNKGYQYYYEQVKVKSKEELEEFNKMNGNFNDLVVNIKSSLNFDSQHNYKTISGGTRADVELSEIIKELKEKKTSMLTEDQKVKMAKIEKHINNNDYFNKVNNSVIQQEILKAVMRFSLRSNEFYGVTGAMKTIIVEKRNDHLLNTIDYSKDSLITYGQLHLEDIINKLTEKGYKVIKKEKIKVF